MALQLDRKTVESIVRDVVMERLGRGNVSGSGTLNPLVVNASARHMHVTQQDLEILFGPGAKLNLLKPLYQDGHFAAQETVTLVGPKSRIISSLRILGPVREYTQIELAYTDAITLGIDKVPVRLSGDIEGTPGAYVMGPKGMLEVKQGVIRAAVHAHMGPEDAAYYGVKDQDIMKLSVRGETSVIFDRVHVRIGKGIKLEIHLDTDEANACGLHLAKEVKLYK